MTAISLNLQHSRTSIERRSNRIMTKDRLASFAELRFALKDNAECRQYIVEEMMGKLDGRCFVSFNKDLQEHLFKLFDGSLENLGYLALGNKEMIRFSKYSA